MSFLGGRGAAREGAYHKSEQEADIQRHRAKLIKEGKLKLRDADEPGDFSASVQAYECLSEVLQQNARIDDPHAAARQEYSRRVRGAPDPLTPEEALRYGGRRYAIGHGMGHVPAMTFGRNRYSVPMPAAAGGGLAAAPPRQLSPEALETARRIQSSGVRALVYGTLLAAISIAAAGTYAARALDIRSGADFQARAQALSQPLSRGVQARVLPLKEAAQAWLGGYRDSGDSSGSSSNSNTSEFQRRLSERWNPPRE